MKWLWIYHLPEENEEKH